MIRYIKRTLRDSEARIEKELGVGNWVIVSKPDNEEIKRVVDEQNLEEGHIRDALDIFEVPRLEIEDKTAYIFTRIPNAEAKNLFTTPLLIVIGNKHLTTISEYEYGIFDKFLEKKIGFYTTQKIKLFIQIFKEINSKYNLAITQISRSIYNTSTELDRADNKRITQLVFYEQKLNDYLNALVRNSTILNTLMSGRTVELYEEDKDMIEDLVLASDQLVQLAKNSLTTVRNIRDAQSTILTNNLNKTIKLLTSLTIILTVPTMIASFFGMNVDLPIMSEIGFWEILGASIGISTVLVFIFYKKDWF